MKSQDDWLHLVAVHGCTLVKCTGTPILGHHGLLHVVICTAFCCSASSMHGFAVYESEQVLGCAGVCVIVRIALLPFNCADLTGGHETRNK